MDTDLMLYQTFKEFLDESIKTGDTTKVNAYVDMVDRMSNRSIDTSEWRKEIDQEHLISSKAIYRF